MPTEIRSATIASFTDHPDKACILPPMAKHPEGDTGFDQREALNDALRASLEVFGQLVPVDVIERNDGTFYVVNGSRRLEQARAAGLSMLKYRIWDGDPARLLQQIVEEALVSRYLTVGQRVILVLDHLTVEEKQREQAVLDAGSNPADKKRDKFIPLGRWRSRVSKRYGVSEHYLKIIDQYVNPSPHVEKLEARLQFADRVRDNLRSGNWNPHQAEKEYKALFAENGGKKSVATKKQEATDAQAAKIDDQAEQCGQVTSVACAVDQTGDLEREKARADALEATLETYRNWLGQAHTLIVELHRHADAPDPATEELWDANINALTKELTDAGIITAEIRTDTITERAINEIHN